MSKEIIIKLLKECTTIKEVELLGRHGIRVCNGDWEFIKNVPEELKHKGREI